MQMPPQLQRAIEQVAARHREQDLVVAAAEVSDAYRGERAGLPVFLNDDPHRAAYLAVRMPATFAAVAAVLEEVLRLLPDLRAESLLDLGAGPGTVGWAATALLPGLRRVTCWERDPALIDLARALAQAGGNAALADARFRHGDVTQAEPFDDHDLVVSAYALNEMSRPDAETVARCAWQAATTGIIFVEPGTVAGFGLIRALREVLLEAGAHLLAPCPHAGVCPMSGDDWCHFSVRAARSALHRRIKGGTLSYEDEKIAYLVALKSPADPAPARILRHPVRHAGHTHLELCTPDGLRPVTVTRSDRAGWRAVRKARWGDAWF